GIMAPSGGMSFREYTFRQPSTVAEAQQRKFGPKAARIIFASRARIVGPGLRLRNADPAGNAGENYRDFEMTESSALLWGESGQRLLAELTVGIAGLGGVGGMLAEYLARLGVGGLVLVDYDRLENANFNRSQGTTRSEARSRSVKVAVYRRVTREAATYPNFKVSIFRESVAENAGLNPLLDCDIIAGAADD